MNEKKSNVFLNFYKIIKYIDRENIKDIIIWGNFMFLLGILPTVPLVNSSSYNKIFFPFYE